ncbi:MAG: PilN domain-containing protein [Bdellovibrionales bacterium]|nr:PilN domain-containing protein [Bdellovibrionales bacterium]
MIRINLIPTKAEHKRRGAILQLVFGGVVVGIVVICCVVFNASMESKIQREQAEINDLNAQINKLKTIIAEVENFKKKRRDLETKIQTIKDLNDKRTGPVKLIDEFSAILPRKAWITNYSEVDKRLNIEGRAMDGSTISDFVQSLRESKFFYNVQLVQVDQSSENGKKIQKFNITAQVNYTAGSA